MVSMQFLLCLQIFTVLETITITKIVMFYQHFLIVHCHKLENKNSIECWGSGKPRREFMHVDDLAEACIFALEKWDPKSKNAPLNKYGEPLEWLNVGTGFDITIKDLAQKISDLTLFKGDILWNTNKPDGTFQKLLDSSKINSLGWEPKISLEEGLRMTYSEYKKETHKQTLRYK